MQYKLGAIIANSDNAHIYENRFTIEQTTEAQERLCISAAADHSELLLALAEELDGPFYLLYLLHTPRGPHQAARYQSPPLEWAEVRRFLREFQPFLSQDGRHDLWLHAAGDDATVVWDRHNLLYAYGPLPHFEMLLEQRRFAAGPIDIPVPHAHHYYPAFDADEERILRFFDWQPSPLEEGDEQ